jgi:transposase InsO family protein
LKHWNSRPPPGPVYHSDRGVESFYKTLKREEIYANAYRDLGHLRTNMAAFIDQYYNRCRLHSALGYRPPEEFERAAPTARTA